jgi:hypothetical protein
MWCWKRMEVSWTDRLKNWVLRRAMKERNIVHTTWRRKLNWIGYTLQRNCLIKHVVLGKIEGTRRGGRKRKQLLDDLKEKEGTGSWKTKHLTALCGEVSFFVSDYGAVAKHTNHWINDA